MGESGGKDECVALTDTESVVSALMTWSLAFLIACNFVAVAGLRTRAMTVFPLERS